MKKRSFHILLIVLAMLITACTNTTLPDLPVPTVPAEADLVNAQNQWQSANYPGYSAVIEETDAEGTRRITIVIDDGQIINALVAEQISPGVFTDPVPMPFNEAEAYAIENIFARVIQDVRGQGDVLYNMDVIFDPVEGYPSTVTANALPSYNEKNELSLNRQHNYKLAMNVRVLLEDIFGLNKTPIMIYTRTGGPDGWCDKLRVYEDGSSIYSNECSQLLLQISPPRDKFEELVSLASNFSSMDELQDIEMGRLQLIVAGGGSGTPDANTQLELWGLADNLMELLSVPVGEGVTLLFGVSNQILGISMQSFTIQNSAINVADLFYSGTLSPDNADLYYSDAKGIKAYNLELGDETSVTQASGEERFRLRGANETLLIVSRFNADESVDLGWVRLPRGGFFPIATDAGCDLGVSVSPDGTLAAFGGQNSLADCSRLPGLSILNIASESMETVISETITAGAVSFEAGVYSPAWSPDGGTIAFGMDTGLDANGETIISLYMANPDGSGLTRLTDNETGQVHSAAYGPDGRLFYTLNGVSGEADGIYIYDPAEGTITQLVAIPGLRLGTVGPGSNYLTYFEDDGDLRVLIVPFKEIVPVVSSGGFPIQVIGWLDDTGD